MAEKKTSNPDWGWFVLLGIVLAVVIIGQWNTATNQPTLTPSPEPNNPTFDRPSYEFQDGKCVEVKGVDDWDNGGDFTGAPHNRFADSSCTITRANRFDPSGEVIAQNTAVNRLFHFSCRLEGTNETITVERKCWYVPRFGLEACNFDSVKSGIPKLMADSNGVFRNADCG